MLIWFWPRRLPDLNIPSLFFFAQRSNHTQKFGLTTLYTHTPHARVHTQRLHPHRPLHLFSGSITQLPPVFLCSRLCFPLSHARVTYSLGGHPSFTACLAQLSWNFIHNIISSSYTMSQYDLLPFLTHEFHRTQLCLMIPNQSVLCCFPLFPIFFLLKEGRNLWPPTFRHRHTLTLFSIRQNPVQTTKCGVDFDS